MSERDVISDLTDTLGTIADFAVGNGDVCEIIAKRARAALRRAAEAQSPAEALSQQAERVRELEARLAGWQDTLSKVQRGLNDQLNVAEADLEAAEARNKELEQEVAALLTSPNAKEKP